MSPTPAATPTPTATPTATPAPAPNGIETLPERLLSAKFALWSGLLTANALIAAGVIAWAYSTSAPSSAILFANAIASTFGVLAPVYCFITVASAEAEAAGIVGWSCLKTFRSIRVKFWGPLELMSALCLLGTFISLIWQTSSKTLLV